MILTLLGHFANFLQDRVGESLWWFLTSGFWQDQFGTTQYELDDKAEKINKQVGFARALLFNGLSAGNQEFIDKATIIANLVKGQINFYDYCVDQSYNFPFLRLSNDNSYWWYQEGWRLNLESCGNHNNPTIDSYTGYVEDIGHGIIDTWLLRDFYEYLPNSPINQTDMIRLRNMFTKQIHDSQSGSNHFLVDGTNSPIHSYIQDELNQNQGLYKDAYSMNYIWFAKFDGGDLTAGPPNAYDIGMTTYSNIIDIENSLPVFYRTSHLRGHSDLVSIQWENECTNLTLYNRDVVYDQDFFSKCNLTIAPEEGPTVESYAHPKIYTQDFIVEPTIASNFSAATSVSFKPGTHLKSGCEIHVYIDPALCNIPGGGKSYVEDSDSTSMVMEEEISNSQANANGTNHLQNNISEANQLAIYPNPFSSELNLIYSTGTIGYASIFIYDMFGKKVEEVGQNQYSKLVSIHSK